MKIVLKYIFLLTVIFLIILGAKETSAQKIDAFARVNIAPREGVVRQQYKVTIVVYSSTWFAKSLQFTNLKIDNAFIIPFSRTVSSINYINKKKYATLSFYYMVFPYNTGTLEIPELVINTSIPPEGESKGEPVSIKTKAQKIEVNPIPSSKNKKVWMVAKNVTINEEWDKSLENLKVGDVVERKITITAEGTLPTFIQPLEIEKPELASIYPKEPVLQDKRNDNDANGERTEKYAYLFEKEGELVIPEEEVIWWNPYTKRVYKRTIGEKIIIVAPNPDLDLMISLRDSLQAMTTLGDAEVLEEKTFPWIRILAILIVLFILYQCIKLVVYYTKKLKTKRAVYRQSEAYYFKELLKTLNNKSTDIFIRELYFWFDKARKPEQVAAIYYYLNPTENEFLENIIQDCYSNKAIKIQLEKKEMLLVLLKKLRNKIKNPELQTKEVLQLNPV